MKITKDALKKLIKQQLNEQYKIDDTEEEFVGPPQEEEPNPMDPENQWFEDPGIPVGTGGGPYKPDYGIKGMPMQSNTPGMPTPIKDGVYPIQTPEGPIYEAWVYNEPKYQEYFDWLKRQKKLYKKRFPGQDRSGRTDPRDPQYVPGYQRSRPPMAESKKITKSQLKQIIKEELKKLLENPFDDGSFDRELDKARQPRKYKCDGQPGSIKEAKAMAIAGLKEAAGKDKFGEMGALADHCIRRTVRGKSKGQGATKVTFKNTLSVVVLDSDLRQ